MDNKDKLQEQAAPLKNNDDAFVQVGENGEPVIPEVNEKEKGLAEEQERITTLDKR